MIKVVLLAVGLALSAAAMGYSEVSDYTEGLDEIPGTMVGLCEDNSSGWFLTTIAALLFGIYIGGTIKKAR